jgi:hypothetical protein
MPRPRRARHHAAQQARRPWRIGSPPRRPQCHSEEADERPCDAGFLVTVSACGSSAGRQGRSRTPRPARRPHRGPVRAVADDGRRQRATRARRARTAARTRHRPSADRAPPAQQPPDRNEHGRAGGRSRRRHPNRVRGISTGGSIAQQLAVEHPETVRRLVLLSTACLLRSAQRSVWRPPPSPAGAAHVGTRVLAWTAARTLISHPTAAADLAVTPEAEDNFNLAQLPRPIRATTLIVAGGRDHFYGGDLFSATAALIPTSHCACCRDAATAPSPAHHAREQRPPAPSANRDRGWSGQRWLSCRSPDSADPIASCREVRPMNDQGLQRRGAGALVLLTTW